MSPWIYFRYLVRFQSNSLHITYLNGRNMFDDGCCEEEFLENYPVKRVSVDIHADLVRECKDKGLVADCVGATDLAFPDQTFDAVHGAKLIECLDPRTAVRFLAESAWLLKRGGIVYPIKPGERYVWTTFSHLKLHPPIAFEKLLRKSIERFIKNQSLSLRLAGANAFDPASRLKVLTGLKCAFNVVFPSRNSTGYVNVFQKTLAVAQTVFEE